MIVMKSLHEVHIQTQKKIRVNTTKREIKNYETYLVHIGLLLKCMR